jgi:hypothetical protein
VAVGLGALPAREAGAQISPGRLSRGHEKLEGSGQCLQCHDPGQGVSAAKCFVCHEPLRARVAAGKGLHARAEYRDCKRCHVEHQGLDYELVWWGKAGRAAFDHSATGQALRGRHAQLRCEECHKTRSFLAAPAACASCHRDEHRGQFGARACDTCHAESAWSPAPGFDHGRTSWPLTGRHAAVACAKCHQDTRRDASARGAAYRVFRAAGRACASCHEDVHGGRLGQACTTCHSTGSWRSSRRADFDHDRTGYALRGRHAAVACDACHRAGKPMRLAHARCSDCHADAHAGQLARRADGGRCESCHDLAGFRPARFTTEDHARTAYPLSGAHLAVPCDACHAPTVRAASARTRLRFASTRCADCHQDAHRGEAARFVRKDGCEACHRVESWRRVAFDHAQTRYRLAGGHERVSCAACHRAARAGAEPRIRFAAVAQSCEGCHRDPHQGQFAAPGQPAACDRCHAGDTLKASKFDHGRHASYALDGAHARVACAACHRTEARAGVAFVRYKPLPTSCKGCHAGDRVARGEVR